MASDAVKRKRKLAMSREQAEVNLRSAAIGYAHTIIVRLSDDLITKAGDRLLRAAVDYGHVIRGE